MFKTNLGWMTLIVIVSSQHHHVHPHQNPYPWSPYPWHNFPHLLGFLRIPSTEVMIRHVCLDIWYVAWSMSLSKTLRTLCWSIIWLHNVNNGRKTLDLFVSHHGNQLTNMYWYKDSILSTQTLVQVSHFRKTRVLVNF